MIVLPNEQTAAWCRQHQISLNEYGLPEKSNCDSEFTIPVDAQHRVLLVSQTMQPFANESVFLVWFNDWSVWPSGQRMHVFDRFRMSYGETRWLIHSPGHVFDQSEIEDAISFVTLAVLFLWDCYIVTPGRSKLLFFSHDEFGLMKGLNVNVGELSGRSLT